MRALYLSKNDERYIIIASAIFISSFAVVLHLLSFLDAEALFARISNDTRLIENFVCGYTEGAFLISFLTFECIIATILCVSLFACFYCKYKSERQSDMIKFNHIDTDLVKTYGRTRKMAGNLFKYRVCIIYEEKEDEEVSILKNTSILAGFGHPNLITTPGPTGAFSLTLKEYNDSYPNIRVEGDLSPPHFTQIAMIMRDVLRAVQYLQDNHIYHLDLQLKNILVCWPFEDSRACIAKVGGFAFAKRLEDGKVSCKETGLKRFWRPPEYFLDDGTLEVDAAKIDSWSIGITVYELLSWRMLTILAETAIPPITTFAKLVSTRHVMERKYFSSIIEQSLNIMKNIEHFSRYKFAISMYDLDHKSFINDCWDFVRGLLEFDPDNRFSVERALNTPLIKKVRDKPKTRKPHGKLLTKCIELIPVLCKN